MRWGVERGQPDLAISEPQSANGRALFGNIGIYSPGLGPAPGPDVPAPICAALGMLSFARIDGQKSEVTQPPGGGLAYRY
jgi:hypothetical protein